MAPKVIVLGWDSATFDVVDPLLEAGRLPALAEVLRRGTRAPLRSTWPPMTDCAWTSAFTGCNPGKHGIFGSWYRAPGEYACRYFSSRDRRAPALWELTEDVRHLVWGVPMAYPPQRIRGAMVSTYGAPPGAGFCEPAALQDELARRWPIDDLLDRAPHGALESFRDDLVRGLEVQADALVWAAREMAADCVVAVWPHVDRAQHFFWRFRATDHPLAGAVETVYEAMDRSTGAVLEAFGDADVLIVSDHGAGPLLGDVNLGAWLMRRGLAAPGRTRRSRLLQAAWAMPPALRKLGKRLAPGAARRAVGATLTGQLGSFDWAGTEAFMGFHSDLWLNLEGREPVGTVSEERAEVLLEELQSELAGLTDPRTGARVFGGVHRRDELFSGPLAHLAPDLMLDTWSAGYRVAPGRNPGGEFVTAPAPLSGVDVSWSSDHRPLGIFAAAGPNIARGDLDELRLYDVAPTVLALLGSQIPGGLDGNAAERALTAAFLDRHPVTVGSAARERAAEGGFSAEEAAAVAEHLKDLGYIE